MICVRPPNHFFVNTPLQCNILLLLWFIRFTCNIVSYSLVNNRIRLIGAYKLISAFLFLIPSIEPCVAPITSRSPHILKTWCPDDTISILLLLQLLLFSAKWKWHGHTKWVWSNIAISAYLVIKRYRHTRACLVFIAYGVLGDI